jgi:hypothetical protein
MLLHRHMADGDDRIGPGRLRRMACEMINRPTGVRMDRSCLTPLDS